VGKDMKKELENLKVQVKKLKEEKETPKTSTRSFGRK